MHSTAFQTGSEISWENPAEGIKRKVYGYNEQLMLVKLEFEAGAIGTLHQHPHVQASYVESGIYELTINGEKQILKAGDGYFVQPNLVHGLVCIEPGVLVEAFTPCRVDMLKK